MKSEIISLFESGLSYRQIAKQLNLTPGQVSGRVRRAGVRRHKPDQPKATAPQIDLRKHLEAMEHLPCHHPKCKENRVCGEYCDRHAREHYR